MNITAEEIQEAIATSSRRQILEDVIEELASEALDTELTPQQMRVAVELAITGKGSSGIAANYGLSPRTIQSHLAEVYARTCAANQREFLSAVICKLLEARDNETRKTILISLLDPGDNAEDWELVIENGEVIARLKGEKL